MKRNSGKQYYDYRAGREDVFRFLSEGSNTTMEISLHPKGKQEVCIYNLCVCVCTLQCCISELNVYLYSYISEGCQCILSAFTHQKLDILAS